MRILHIILLPLRGARPPLCHAGHRTWCRQQRRRGLGGGCCAAGGDPPQPLPGGPGAAGPRGPRGGRARACVVCVWGGGEVFQSLARRHACMACTTHAMPSPMCAATGASASASASDSSFGACCPRSHIAPILHAREHGLASLPVASPPKCVRGGSAKPPGVVWWCVEEG